MTAEFDIEREQPYQTKGEAEKKSGNENKIKLALAFVFIVALAALILASVYAYKFEKEEARFERAIPIEAFRNVDPTASESVEMDDVEAGSGTREVRFEPAIPLEEFRSVDPNLFEWVKPDDVQAGGTACGFLHADLALLPDVTYPKVKVYVCIKFAKNQPAPRGNLAVHCGGPGTLSNCVDLMGGPSLIGFDNPDNYNVIGFDQRGMGQSEPSFMVEECGFDGLNYTDAYDNLNYSDVSSFRPYTEVLKQRVYRCWTYPGFQLTVDAKSDTGEIASKTYHFLEYSGTRQLAEDIWRIRKIFGDQKISVYGISYGTKVMGLFATIFPDYVNLMVLDANVDPGSDIVKMTETNVESMNQRIDYIIYSCNLLEYQSPGSCPIRDFRACFNDVQEMLNERGKDGLVAVLIATLEDRVKLCNAVEAGDADTVNELVGSWKNITQGERKLQDEEDPDYNRLGRPSEGNIFPYFSGFNSENSSIAQDMVWAQDNSNGAYDDVRFARTLVDLNTKYPAAGTNIAVRVNALQWYSALFYWPMNTPLPPLGNAQLLGVIAGQLYDPWTPYSWTQKMRENFPQATLLTSRSTSHGLSRANDIGGLEGRCIANYQRYFRDGFIDFVDGTVCASDYAALGSCNLAQVFNGERC